MSANCLGFFFSSFKNSHTASVLALECSGTTEILLTSLAKRDVAIK